MQCYTFSLKQGNIKTAYEKILNEINLDVEEYNNLIEKI